MRRSRASAAVIVAALACVPCASAAHGRFPPAPKLRSATVWAVGDGAFPGPSSRQVARLVARGAPTRFLYLGDVYPEGTAGNYARGYAPIYGSLAPITLPTPGNHEWGNRSQGYSRYWSRIIRGAPPSHYAVTVAGWRIVSANSEEPHGAGSRQVKWLRAQMAVPGTCKLVFWHRPRFSGGLHGDATDIAPLWNATLGHAALVLNGHDHDMQRMRPVRGVTELVSGAGGYIHYRVDTSHPRLAWSNDRVFGAVRLDLRPGSARYSFVSAAGTILDSGSVRCRVG